MLCVTKLWILFLCYKSIECEKTVENRIPFYDIVSVDKCSSDPLLYNIEITYSNGKIVGTIFRNKHPGILREPVDLRKIEGAFFLTNCDLASWIMTKIFNLIKMSPLLYQNKFVYDEMYDTDYKDSFDYDLNAFLKLAVKFDKFQEVLNVFVNYKPNMSLFKKIGITNTITSMLIKTINIPSLQNNETENSKIHFNIIRLLLIDVIDLQKYLLLNCPEKPANSKNSQLTGIWISSDEEQIADDRIDTIISIAEEQFKFATKYKKRVFCNPRVLLNFININLESPGFIEIATAKVKITQDKNVSIEDILERMKKNYDMKVVTFYHDFILIAIMKQIILFTTKIFAKQEMLRNDVCVEISQINTKLQSTYSPSYIKEGIHIINNVITNETPYPNNVHVLENYLKESLSSVSFDESSTSNITISNGNDINDTIWNLLKTINNNIPNFKCFRDYLTTYKEKYEAYYRPFAKNMNFLLQQNNDKKVEEECDFVTSVFSIGYQSLIFLNAYFDSKSNDDKNMFLDGVKNIYRSIQIYFHLIVKHGTDNIDILKIAYDLSTIMLNFSINFQRPYFENELKRVLNVIMNEMNSYSLKYCTSTDNDFLIFNNINFYEFGNADIIDISIKTYFKNNVNMIFYDGFKFETSINDKDYDHLNVQYFIDTFIKYTMAYKTYSEKILYSWNDSTQTIQSVLKYETVIMILPGDVRDIYEAYFKFSAAVIFFRIKEILKSSKTLATIETAFNNIIDTFNSRTGWLDFFPLEFKDVLESINNNLLFFPNEKKKNATRITERSLIKELKSRLQPIEEKFKLLHISFPDEQQDATICLKMKCLKWDNFKYGFERSNASSLNDSFKALLLELLKNVENVKKNYLKLIGEPSSKS